MNQLIQIPIVSLSLALASIGGVLIPSSAFATEVVSEPSTMERQMELVRHQVTPDVLCAAGVTETQVADVISDAFDAINDHWDALISAQSARDLLKIESSELQRLIESGQADDTQITRFGDLDTLITSANSSYEAVYNAIDQGILDSMSTAQQQAFLAIRTNAHRSVPMEYRVLSLDEDGWIELRDAIAALKTFDVETGEDNPTAAQQLINQFDGSYEVNLARVNLQTRLDTVTQYFMSAISSAN